MARLINKNLKYIHQSWSNQKYDSSGFLVNGKRGVVLEGSSRSGKTWSVIDFIILLCTRYETNCTINIIKETYNEFKTTLYNDFSKRLNDFGLENPFESKQEVSSFKIFDNKINFLGADKPSKFHGAQCDYFWINETLPVSKAIFDQQEMRCTKFWVMDYNPSVTEHWIFNSVIPRPDVGYLHTTYLDNPFCSIPERNKILSYEPTAKNIENGTADDYMWKVYGLGLRGAMQGLIFKNVNWVDNFPIDVRYQYGLDFGFTNDPTALVKVGTKDNDLFLQLLCYEPIDNSFAVGEMFKNLGIEKGITITADSSDRFNDVEMCRELRNIGYDVKKVDKGKGILWRIGLMKKYRINIVRDVNFKREQENYKWREINGICINEPLDKFNHAWDASGYGFLGMQNNAPQIIW
jgi:PBSX family phage terminase large subunit